MSRISTSPSASIMPRGDNAGLVGAQIERLGAVARELEGNLLEVQDDVGCVFDNAGDGLELVQHALNANGGDGGAFDWS